MLLFLLRHIEPFVFSLPQPTFLLIALSALPTQDAVQAVADAIEVANVFVVPLSADGWPAPTATEER